MSDLVPDSFYDWVFVAASGDRYAGFMYDDTGVFTAGQMLPAAQGHYEILTALPYGFELGPTYGVEEGTVYTTSYFDAVQGNLQTANFPFFLAPSSVTGLGQEFDYAWNGEFWDDFGHGGALQAGLFG